MAACRWDIDAPDQMVDRSLISPRYKQIEASPTAQQVCIQEVSWRAARRDM